MVTGKKPASLAGKGLRKKKTPASQKTVDASDLAQAKRKTKAKATAKPKAKSKAKAKKK